MSAIKIDKKYGLFYCCILGGNNMGFLDVLQAAGNHLNESLPQKYEALCKRAPDSGLLRTYEEKRFDPDVDPRFVEALEKEIRHRGLD